MAKGGASKNAALRLNCYSSGAARFPPAAQPSEGIGAKLVCLRTLLRGFWVSRIPHDQDTHIGELFVNYFLGQECYDRAHIAVCLNDGVVLTKTNIDTPLSCHRFFLCRPRWPVMVSALDVGVQVCRPLFTYYLLQLIVVFLPLPCRDLYISVQKNVKKNIAKWAKRDGDRAVRNFASASVRSRQVWLDAGGKEKEEWVWAKAFIQFFSHLAFHLQGE